MAYSTDREKEACKVTHANTDPGRRLGDRFREHLRDVEKNDKDASKPVGRHFNLPNHSKKTHGYLRPFLTSRYDGKPQESGTKIHLSNRHP